MIRAAVILSLVLCSNIVFSQHTVNSNLFGFATSNSFTYFNVEDTSFTNKILKISPKVLRFPGGAVGNFYHYDRPAYGFNLAEIEKWHKAGFPKRARGLLKSSHKFNHNQNYIEDFIQLVKLTNSSVILVANIITADIKELYLMIEHMQKEGVNIIGIELGSELSNRAYYLAGFTKNKYIKIGKEFAKKLKEKYPEIKIGVVAAPIVKEAMHRHTLWNKSLAEHNFYDAIIIHSYAKVTKGKSQYGQMISEIPEGSNKLEAFDLYKERALEYIFKSYPKEIESYKLLFNKPFWITEWNLQISRITGNTLLQGLFVSNYFLELNVGRSLSNIKLTTFHNLAGRDVSGSIFMNDGDSIHIHSTFIPIQMISDVFHDEDLFCSRSKVSSMCYQYNFTNNTNSAIKYSFWINWSDKPILIPLQDDQLINIEKYFGNRLYLTPDSINGLEYIKRDNILLNNITLNPYSFTKVSF